VTTPQPVPGLLEGMNKREIELSAGTIEYTDTGGTGPVIVLLHGLLMDASLWDDVIANLAPGYRCVAPTLPLGAHQRPVNPDTNLSLPGMAAIVGEFLGRLGLTNVTLVGNDTGGALTQVFITGGPAGLDRVGRMVLVSCEAFDNFPPGLTGKTVALAGKFPPWLFGLAMQQMRIRPLRQSPMAFGWLTKRGHAATARWVRPVLSQPAIRRDTVAMLRAVFADRDLLVRAADALPGFTGPTLIVWAAGDRVMPPEHGRRLAGLLPQARLVEVADSYTLIPLDQPAELARLIAGFVPAPAGAAPPQPA
jgi:pimeloyl-ACP methyl ester carboxylesterase